MVILLIYASSSENNDSSSELPTLKILSLEKSNLRLHEKKNNMASLMTNLPEDIETHIRSHVDNSSLQKFWLLSKAHTWFHNNPKGGISIIYEEEFSYKRECIKKIPSAYRFPAKLARLSMPINLFSQKGKYSL